MRVPNYYSEWRVKRHYTLTDEQIAPVDSHNIIILLYLQTRTFRNCSQECLTTGFRFSVTHDDPPFGQSEPHDECGGNSSGDDTIIQPPQNNHHQQDHGGNHTEKPVTCDYLSPYAFTARNSLGSTSGTCKAGDKPLYLYNVCNPTVITISIGKMRQKGPSDVFATFQDGKYKMFIRSEIRRWGFVVIKAYKD